MNSGWKILSGVVGRYFEAPTHPCLRLQHPSSLNQLCPELHHSSSEGGRPSKLSNGTVPQTWSFVLPLWTLPAVVRGAQDATMAPPQSSRRPSTFNHQNHQPHSSSAARRFQELQARYRSPPVDAKQHLPGQGCKEHGSTYILKQVEEGDPGSGFPSLHGEGNTIR